MAGDWIKFEHVTPDKPEVIAIAGILQIDQDAVVGKLLRLWVWADQQTTDGNAKCNAAGVTKNFIDRCTCMLGFADAMEDVGWLRTTDSGTVFPNFDRHNGETAKQRGLTSKRVRKHRVKCNAECNGVSVTSSLPEKRREEKSITPSLSRPDGLNFAENTDIPDPYQTAEFLKAWSAWLSHRATAGKPVTGPEADMQLADMLRGGWDAARATAAVQFTIRQGGRGGIFENDRQSQARGKAKTQTPIEDMDLTR